MWQELSDLRERYLVHTDLESDVYRNNGMLLFLYELLQLSGCGMQKQEFVNMTETGEHAHTIEGVKVFDLWKAFLYVRDEADGRRELGLSFVQSVAARVMKHTGGETTTSIGRYDSSLGDFRLGEDYDEVYPLTDFRKVPDALDALCRYVNSRINEAEGVESVRLAADFMYEFAHIKPFGAGNLETGILLMNYIQVYRIEPLIVLFAEDHGHLLNVLKRGKIDMAPRAFEDFVAEQQVKMLNRAAFWEV